MQSTVDEDYYTLKEIADRLKVSYRTVHRWVKSGKLAAYKFGGDWRVGKSDLDKYVESAKYKPPGEEGVVSEKSHKQTNQGCRAKD